jgi:hypothetical protein
MDLRWPEQEQRFLVEADEVHRFLAAVQPHLPVLVHDPARPVEFVRTTYFDTDDDMLLRSRTPGREWRVRVRQYADAPDHLTPPRLRSDCAFEVKESSPTGRHKVRALGSPDEIGRMVAARAGGVRALGSGRISPLLAHAARTIECGQLAPRLTTWYRRLALEAGAVRVTVDQQVEFARPIGLGPAGEPAAPRAVAGRGPPLVLEVKLRAAPPDWLLRAMRQLALVTQFSKFRDGLLALRSAERPPRPPPGGARSVPPS